MAKKKKRKKGSAPPGGGALLLRALLFATATGLALLFLLVALVSLNVFGPLPSEAELAAIENEEATLVFAEDGTLIGKLFAEDRTNIRYEDLPQHLIDALVSTEDARFFEHQGVDGTSYVRVLLRTILGGDRSGGGGSTISQQIIKNLYGRERHGPLTVPVNKIKEALVAQRLERVYDKRGVLVLYLNSVPFGENLYGIESAARRFFGRSTTRLGVEEAAVLVGMLKANTAYNPRLHPDRARERRNTVLGLMEKHGHLSAREADSLQALPLKLRYTGLDAYDAYGYFVARVEREAGTLLREAARTAAAKGARKGARGKAVGPDPPIPDLRKDGLRIHTTLDPALQHLAVAAARTHLARMQPRLDAELKASKARAAWERSKAGKGDRTRKADVRAPRELYDHDGVRVDTISVGDSLWHYHRLLNAAVLMMEPATGNVRAWVGGGHHRYLPYDLVEARRSIASAIKPVIYAAALEAGRSPCMYLSNAPRIYSAYDDWSPRNFDGDTTGGEVALWAALAQSMNLPTVDLYFQLDKDSLRDMVRALGIPGVQVQHPSVCLGSSDLSLLDMVPVYAAFAARGQRPRPRLITRITDAEGKVLYEAPRPRGHRALTPGTADAMNALLRRAVDQGTGTALRTRYGVAGAVAGKTGTSQDQRDAWFFGYTPGLVVGTWVGARDPAVHFRGALGTGSQLALPIAGQVFHGIEAGAGPRKRYMRPFTAPDSARYALDCPPRHDPGWLERLFEGRPKDPTDSTARPGLLRRIFGRREEDP